MDGDRDFVASECENIFNNIQNLDLFQIKANLDNFFPNYNQSDGTEKLRLVLKKSLLEELLKFQNENSSFFQRCLNETNERLSSVGGDKDVGFACCFIGCKFRAVDHRNFVIHLKKNHPNIKSIICNFRNTCKRSFPSVDELVSHLKQEHAGQNQNLVDPVIVGEIDVPCKCDQISCGQKNFSSTKLLMRHYNSYHANQSRECIFSKCKTIFHAACPASALNHFRIKHKQTGNMTLKSRYVFTEEEAELMTGSSQQGEGVVAGEVIEGQGVDTENVIGDQRVPAEDYYDEVELNFDDMDALDITAEEESGEDYYLQYYSDYLNRLAHFKFIPQRTIQEIVEEQLLNTKKSLEKRERVLRRSLTDTGKLLPAEIDKVITDVFENDAFMTAQRKLNSEYKRIKIIQESPTYIAPKEIILNKSEVKNGQRKEVLHYISILDSFKNLVQDPSFCKMLECKEVLPEDEKLRDLKDGIIYKNNRFFQQNPEAYAAILYSDAVEIKVLCHSGNRLNCIFQVDFKFKI